MCPACGKPYEYCHGHITKPYFRHKEKDQCLDKYYEPETDEHINGKILLTEWLAKQPHISNIRLESWIPETHQRPDITFTIGDKQFVIEYQCTPISSEYIERHELYQAAGITDIWIIGVEKYKSTKSKFIEEKCNIQLNSSKKVFIIGENIIRKYYTNNRSRNLYSLELSLEEVMIDEFGNFKIDGRMFDEYKYLDALPALERTYCKAIQNDIPSIKYVGKLSSPHYNAKLEISIDAKNKIIVFAKCGTLDVCILEEYRKPILRWSTKQYRKTFRGTESAIKHKLINTFQYDTNSYESFKDCLLKIISEFK